MDKETYRQIWGWIFAIAVIFAVFIGKSMTEFDKDVVAKEAYEEGYEEGWEDYESEDEYCNYDYLGDTDMAFDPEGDDIQVSHGRYYLIGAIVLFTLFVIYSYRRHDRCVSLFFTPLITSFILTLVYFTICYVDGSRHLLGRTFWAYFALAWSIGIWMVSIIGEGYEGMHKNALDSYREEIASLEGELKEKEKSERSNNTTQKGNVENTNRRGI